MKNKKLFWFIVILAFVLFAGLPPVYGGDASRTGTAGGVQLLVPVGARDLAMGGANIAFTTGLEAIYWNPAGLSSMTNNAAAQFSTMNFFEDIRVNYLAIAVKSSRIGTFGFSLKAFDFGDIPVTTNQDMDGKSGRTFSPTFITTGLTYSRRLTDAIQVGVTGKIVSESIPRASASAVAFDAGIQYHQFGGISGLSIGMAVKNVGTELQYKGSAFLDIITNPETGLNEFRDLPTAKHELPANIELGAGYTRNVAENSSVILTGIFQSNNMGNDVFKVGFEYAYTDLVALRGGYLFYDNVNTDDVLYRFTLGVGLHYKLGGTDLTLDYAFRDDQYFDSNNMFSIQIGF